MHGQITVLVLLHVRLPVVYSYKYICVKPIPSDVAEMEAKNKKGKPTSKL